MLKILEKELCPQLVLNYGPCRKQHWKNCKILTVGDFDDDDDDDGGGGYDNDDKTTVTKTG